MNRESTGILGSLVQLVFALVAAVFAAIVASWPLLYIFLRVEHLNELVDLSVKQVMTNYNSLMSYLLVPFVTKLQMPDLPTSSGAASHFYEVKNLFMIVLALFVALLLFMFYAHKKKINLWIGRKTAVLFMVLPLVVLPFALLNFDAFFVLFHGVFFHNSDWLFDPVTDPIINVLSENFFAACFAIFLVVYEFYLVRFVVPESKKG